MIDKEKILAGRKAVDAYRTAHTQLHSRPWHKRIPEEHTPLLNKLLAKLKKQGFNSLDEFFTANEELCWGIFSDSYTVEGSCRHTCHGQEGGCRDIWYQARMEVTQGELLEPLFTLHEAYSGSRIDPTPRTIVRPACTYRIVKVNEPEIDWRWK